MLKHYSRDLILSVKEMLERRLDVIEIASRMNLDVEDIRMILDLINQIVT
jgi:hypothetical protein